MKYFILALTVFLMVYGNAWGLSLDFDNNWKEITIYDGYGSNQDENNETEPYTLSFQDWDLEGMFLSGNSLIIMSGYDFRNGTGNTTIGDLYFGDKNNFDIDTDSDVTHVFRFERDHEYIDIHDSGTIAGYKYNGNGVGGTSYDDLWYGGYDTSYGTGSYNAGVMENVPAIWDWDNDTDHYFLEITGNSILSLFADGKYAHIMMSCGNDQLRGQIAPVPEPTTILLSGLGILGIGVFFRKKMFVKGMM